MERGEDTRKFRNARRFSFDGVGGRSSSFFSLVQVCRSFNRVVVGLAKCVSKTRLAQQRRSATNSPTLFACRCELFSLSATKNLSCQELPLGATRGT